MPINRLVRCLLFDLGSTLWQHEEEGMHLGIEVACRRVGELLHGTHGGEIFATQDALELGRQVRQAIIQMLQEEKRQRPEYEPDFAQTATQALQLLGLAEDDAELGARVFEALRVRIPTSHVLFPDTLSTLEALHQRGYLLGVVTNRDHGGQPFYEDLQNIGMLKYFEYQHMAISADLRIRKPNPAIFKYALNRLNAVPEESAMVGDNLMADIGGAKRLNMLGIWKIEPEARQKQHVKQDAIVPDMTIHHLQELLKIF